MYRLLYNQKGMGIKGETSKQSYTDNIIMLGLFKSYEMEI